MDRKMKTISVSRRQVLSASGAAIVSTLVDRRAFGAQAERPELIGDQFKTRIATLMRQASTRSKIPINTDRMVLATRDGTLIAAAPIMDKRLDEGGDLKPDERLILQNVPFLFAYISIGPNDLSAQACVSKFFAKTSARYDYFIIEANSKGETVLVTPMTADHREAREGDKGLQLGVELTHADLSQTHAHSDKFQVVVGTCRCQRKGLFCWTRLHTVVI